MRVNALTIIVMEALDSQNDVRQEKHNKGRVENIPELYRASGLSHININTVPTFAM